MRNPVSARAVVAVAGAVVSLGALFFCWRTYSTLVDEEHLLEVAHGRLELQMQRRHDLLMNSRSVVAKYAAIEEQIQAHAIELHGLTKAPGPTAELVRSHGSELLDLVAQLDALVEAYPSLKSKGPYVLLMETIQETGFQVTTERLNTNTKAYEYNLTRSLFPANVVALVFGFKERPFLMGPLVYAPAERVS